MKPTLIIDCNALGHTVKHSLGELTHEDLQVGVIYGFLFRILYLARLFETNQFVFCWDSSTNIRYDIFPDYKKKDKEFTEQEKDENGAVHDQFDILRKKVLPALGFKNIFMQKGREGDDVIASVVKNTSNIKRLIIVSSDNDMYQLMDPCCSMYLLKSKKEFTQNDFMEKYNIFPEQWAEVKSLAGCTGDKVPGIKGVGYQTAIKYLKEQLTKGVVFDRIKNSDDVIEFTKRLVVLPIEGTRPITLHPTETFDIEQIIQVLETYDMYTLTSGVNYQTWKEIFCG